MVTDAWVEAWQPAPAQLTGLASDVHVWRAELDLPPTILSSLRTGLSKDELIRAERFHFERDRNRFTAGRGILRLILGRYLQKSPADLRFVYSAFGKPALEESNGIRFNLAHSGGLALYAIRAKRGIGVDVEHIRPEMAGEDIARRFFAPAEVQQLLGLPAVERVPGFFRCWTRKEAMLKAWGQGLSLPLDQFVVTLGPEEPAALRAAAFAPEDVGRWWLHSIESLPGYAGALAVEDGPCPVRFFCWSPDAFPQLNGGS